MAYRILDSDFSDFISTTAKVNTSVNGDNATQISLAGAKGSISYQQQALQQHLSIQESHYQMQEDVSIYGKGEADLLEIQFNLSDNAISYQDKRGVQRITSPRSGNIAFLSAEENAAKILFKKDIAYNTFDIHLPVSVLSQYAGESAVIDQFLHQVQHGISTTLSSHTISITPAIYNTIQDIKGCRFGGLTRKIYLESKVYEIIALLHESAGNPAEGCELNATDREKIHFAASIIENNLERPCSIIDLARQVGVNQTKLKTGFKSLYGNTVFGYLQDIRMHQAKQYLLNTALTMQEIAMLLGYPNASNFSIAFKKIHGYSPIKMRSNKTN